MKRILVFSLAAAAAATVGQPLSARDRGDFARGDIRGSASISDRGVTVQPSTRMSTRSSAAITDDTPRRTVTRSTEPRARVNVDRDTRISRESPSVAFGGTRNVERTREFRRDRNLYPSVDVYRDWDRDRVYRWNNHRWRWSGDNWVIIDATPSVTYSDEVAMSSSLAADVQDALNNRGFNAGPEDGVIGAQTRDAIARYQAAHGLSVTGRIDSSLLRSLGL